jgi:hypothetical protein
MTLEWRIPDAGGIDHEGLWLGVLAAGAAAGALLLYGVGLPPLGCAFKAVTGVPCLTCGFGRSLVCLSHGDIWCALRANPLAPVGALASAVYAMYAGGSWLAGPKRLRGRVTAGESLALRFGVVAVCVATWAWLIVDGR